MTACIYFHPEAYTTSGPKLMGRNAAGESFLRGFLTHSRAQEFWVQAQNRDHISQFTQAAGRAGRTETVHGVDPLRLGTLAKPGVVYHPGPGLSDHAWQRSFFGHSQWSLCGVTHTTSSAGAMDAIVSLLTSPVQPWDALICTSQAVKTNVERVLQAQVNHLQQRLGISKLVLPQLPVIPLGVHTADFVFSVESKAQARQTLGVPSDAIVVLYMGRLSFHAKAHPLAMYQALEMAARKSGKPVTLVECGWHANDFIAKAYAEAAALACPGVKVMQLDGRVPAQRDLAWAAADIFCSLSDNIQETFGITPIEAMAAGLPVVVSDWDGYKDTVRHGVDGFRITTTSPPPGLGQDLAFRHAVGADTYDMYCGHACSFVSVDVQTASEAFVTLFQSDSLRLSMGAAGRQRAVSSFDWATVIGQYESLWQSLQTARIAAGQAATKESADSASSDARLRLSEAVVWPARLDPLTGFSGYPTFFVTPQHLISARFETAEDGIAKLRSLRALAMVRFADSVLMDEHNCGNLIRLITQRITSVSKILEQVDPKAQGHALRTLVHLAKLGLISIADTAPV